MSIPLKMQTYSKENFLQYLEDSVALLWLFP